MSSYIKVLKLDLNARFSNYDYGLLTCPANRPHSVAQSVSGEQLDCSDTQPEANSLQKNSHSPNLFSRRKKKKNYCTLSQNTHLEYHYLLNMTTYCGATI